MSIIQVAGLDPSLSNFGMVKGELDIISGSFLPSEIKLIETKPDKSNKTVRKNSQDLARAESLYKSMTEFIKDVDLVFAELPVSSQSARSMASYGMCISLLASVSKAMIQVMPLEVKLAACGKKTATKAEMISWATQLYPYVNWFTRKYKGVEEITAKNEHIADAIGAIHAGLKTDQYAQAKAIYSKLFNN